MKTYFKLINICHFLNSMLMFIHVFDIVQIRCVKYSKLPKLNSFWSFLFHRLVRFQFANRRWRLRMRIRLKMTSSELFNVFRWRDLYFGLRRHFYFYLNEILLGKWIFDNLFIYFVFETFWELESSEIVKKVLTIWSVWEHNGCLHFL